MKKGYDIKFPFNSTSEFHVLDMNKNANEEVVSKIMHTIFTPKGQRLRKPDFGTNLVQYIFNPNENQSWSDIIEEISTAVKKNVPNCNIKNVSVDSDDTGYGVYVSIIYSVTEYGVTNTYEIKTKI